MRISINDNLKLAVAWYGAGIIFLLVGALFTGINQSVLAQTTEVAATGNTLEGQPEGDNADSSIAEEMQILEANIADVGRQLDEYLQIESASAEGLAEIGLELVQARISVLNKIKTAYQRRISALRAYENASKERTESEAGIRQLQHLTEAPPYTMAFLDQLGDMVDLKKMEVDAENLSLRGLTDLVTSERGDIPTAKAGLNRAEERLRTAAQEVQRAAQFEVETAKMLVTANEAELQAAEMELKQLQTHAETLQLELDLAQRKVALARTQTLFRQKELDEIKERQQAVVDALAAEEQKARSEIERIRAKIPAAEQAVESNPDPGAQVRAKTELESFRMQAETAEIKLTIIEALQNYEKSVIRLWELRFKIANPATSRERLDWSAIVKELQEQLDIINNERNAGEQRAMSLRGQITALESTLREWTEQSGDKRAIQEQLNILSERVLMRNRIQMRLAQIITLTERIIDEVQMHQNERSLMERFSDLTKKTVGFITLGFDRELTVIGEESITGRKLFYMFLILIFGLFLSRLITRYIRNYALRKLKLRSNAVLIIAKLTNYLSFIIVVYLALNYVNIPLTIFAFLGGAIALGIGFGAQNLINNFLSGLILMGEQPIRMGDIVEIEGKLGVITNIGARASQLRMFNGFDLLIPNSKFLETSVINWTLSDSKVRLQVQVGVAYGSPTRDVARLMMRAVTEHGQVLNDPEPIVLFESFGDSTLNFSVYFWIELGPSIDGRVVMSDIRFRIDKLFKEAGIVIAFPQRDIHFDAMQPLAVRVIGEQSALTDREKAVLGKEEEGDSRQSRLP